MTKLIRSNIALAVLAATILVVSAGFLPLAVGQAPVVGSADFRNAPQLPPGIYSDRLVTGDTAWYAVVYTNNTPYEFEVSFQGAEPGREVNLSVGFVAPTLMTIDGPAGVVSGNGLEYPAGHTNVWFLKVSLDTSGQVGIEYPILIRVSGVQTLGTEPCNDTPGCTLAEEYATNNVTLAAARAELEELRAQEIKASVEAEIENLRGFAQTSDEFGPAARQRLAQAEASIAELCAPEPTCDEFPDPGSKTPISGWIIGLVALSFGGYRAIKRFGKGPKKKEPPKPAPRQPAALVRAKK